MKLTKDMFDFEKYDYRFGYPCEGDQCLLGERWVDFHPLAQGHATTLLRMPKPKPRYLLLNEGEKLRPGDEYHSGYVSGWCSGSITPGDSVSVMRGEIWRRVVTP